LTVLLVGVVALLFLAAGCGSKSNSSASAPETTPATETATTETTTTADTTTTSSSSESTDTTTVTETTSTDTGGSSGASGGSSIPKSCLNFAQAAGKLGQALASSGTSATANAESLKTYFNNLADKAPSDIKSAFQTLANAISKYVDALKDLNLKPGQTPNASDMAKLRGVIGELSKPDVQAASNKIQAWVQAGCHS
jgi:hypothetical protein